MIAEAHQGDAVQAVLHRHPALDGVYALAVMDDEAIVLARDRLGVKQGDLRRERRYNSVCLGAQSALAHRDEEPQAQSREECG